MSLPSDCGIVIEFRKTNISFSFPRFPTRTYLDFIADGIVNVGGTLDSVYCS